MLQFFLDMAHRVVAEIARQPPAEAGHARQQRHFKARLVLLDKVQGIAPRHFLHHAARDHFGHRLLAKTAGAQQGVRRQADEAVAAKTFAAHHGFEQKAVLAAIFGMRQLEVEGKRGFQIGKGFQHQRNAVVALRRQAVEFDFGHHERSLLTQEQVAVVQARQQPPICCDLPQACKQKPVRKKKACSTC